MAVTAEQVRYLRDKTGAGIMDCKRALEESGGDVEKAIEYLRKKGAATAQRRADKMAKEGVIVTRVWPNGRRGVVVEVNCETDFVARASEFVNFANTVAELIERHRPSTIDQVLDLSTTAGEKVSEQLNELLAKVREKIEIRRFALFESADGIIGAYTHMGSKIGVLVELAGLGGSNDGAILSRDIAMQVAAMNPQYIKREEVSKDTIDREMDIYRSQARGEGKPEQVVERIAMGRLEKFFQEVCLLEQTFIKDSGKTVKDLLRTGASVRRFQRFHLGEY